VFFNDLRGGNSNFFYLFSLLALDWFQNACCPTGDKDSTSGIYLPWVELTCNLQPVTGLADQSRKLLAVLSLDPSLSMVIDANSRLANQHQNLQKLQQGHSLLLRWEDGFSVDFNRES
jgi:hypothetical protein